VVKTRDYGYIPCSFSAWRVIDEPFISKNKKINLRFEKIKEVGWGEDG